MKRSLCLLLLSGLLSLASAETRPNIVLVMADDHGYGDTGFTGHPFVQTPHLDAMAKTGVVFNRFYASAPVCSPTRASVMTGRHPFRVNVPNHGHYLRPHETTVAEALGSAGYVTGHFGKWHIGSVQKESATSPGGAGFDEWLSGLNFFDNDPYLSRNGEYGQFKGPGSVIAMDATIEFLRKHVKGDKPIFAVTWFPSPHDPQSELPQGLPNAATLYNDKDTKKPGYFREITLLDQQIGKLRKSLRQLGIAENTLLFYCSDNGGLVAESSGGRAKKGSIYEGGLRVPAVMEWPAKYKAKTVDTPAFTSDLYPTLVALAGAKVAHQPLLDGIDLAPVIAAHRASAHGLLAWTRKAPNVRPCLRPWAPTRVLKNVNEHLRRGRPARSRRQGRGSCIGLKETRRSPSHHQRPDGGGRSRCRRTATHSPCARRLRHGSDPSCPTTESRFP